MILKKSLVSQMVLPNSRTLCKALRTSKLVCSSPSHRHPSASSISTTTSAAPSGTMLTITRPDDWHLHVRDGPAMRSVVPHTAEHYGRAVIMPNLTPPVTNVNMALQYKQRIMEAVPAQFSHFSPIMTLYLTDRTSAEDVHAAKAAGVPAFKLYPAGATTNSDSGVTDLAKVLPALKAMASSGVLLLVHGEVTDVHVDMFDREAVFIKEKLIPILDLVPDLKVVMEHITTKEAADFVSSAPDNVAASVTPQHILLNRNALFVKGLRPHNYCLPVLKRELHREAVAAAVTCGHSRFFLGTDSAPHLKGAKEAACGCAGIFSAPVALGLYAEAFEKAGALEKLEAFASFNGPDFYGMPRNTDKITLVKEAVEVPDSYQFGENNGVVVPMRAGEHVEWRVFSVVPQ
ncbi:hypothetical protein CEUSTIGMA_g866.t1 [Chlamydomonas eustigma]|uniref:Dihydroorotase, mitochondrial n=1 Tax=Chlamydomonas eustigma TaxID=1157962 RepID=A0A250WRD3_9CHLO|nr:hypothetical protein CEUSTIGMA_g866.t1 [Chlamydomonas eustigma]|eukprot:GAX73414.1 hypothetical protein CEUSTIGMA_g866.t1 [Chlamydomonas eustigma]